MGFYYALVLSLTQNRDSDEEELLTLQERRRQLLAGKSRAPEEGALESTGAKTDLPAPSTATTPTAAPAKVITEGAKLSTSGLPPRVVLKAATTSPAEPVSVNTFVQMCHPSSPQVREDLLADGYRLCSPEFLSFYFCSLGYQILTPCAMNTLPLRLTTTLCEVCLDHLFACLITVL